MFTDITKHQSEIQDGMYDLVKTLYPICRSITGDGVRETLKIIKNFIDLKTFEVPSGTQVFDWAIPKEWNIKDAYVIDPKGNKIIDFKKSNLHVVSYSVPIKQKISLQKLKNHLHTIPNQPTLIPYLTTYYKEDWGFCLPHEQLERLEEGEYEVFIDSKLSEGHLSYGEFFIKGSTDDEIVISCYVCHPSLCNDNLSGIVISTFLAQYLKELSLHYSYRFLFIPETIGAITWLSKNQEKLSRIKHGLVITCAGDSGCSTYKKSRQETAEIDQVSHYVLKNSNSEYKILNFSPWGSDERQFCSPAFNLPFGSLLRSMYNDFPEYHTSADNLDFIKKEALLDTFSKCLRIISILEQNKKFQNVNPKCEPQLGRRGIYSMTGGSKKEDVINNHKAILWVLNYSDGKHSLLDIAEKSEISFEIINDVAEKLSKSDLLQEIKY